MIDDYEYSVIIDSLNGLRNKLIADGRYTDAVDELIIKFAHVSLGRIKHWYTGNEYWIDDLAILPKTQGRGCGSKFIDLIEDYIKAKDFVGIVLFTEKDIPAYNLYVKKGFTEKPERVFFEKKIF